MPRPGDPDTLPSVSSHHVSATDLARVLWKPTLYRGIVAILFALIGIFFGAQATPLGLAAALAAWLLLSALFMWPVTRLAGLPPVVRTGITSATLVWAVAGVGAAILRDPVALAVMAILALAIGGVSELIPGLRERAYGRPMKDMVISGGVSLLGAAILAAVVIGMSNAKGVDVHGVYGTLSMIVALLGVHLVIAGLGYRHDAAAATSAA